MEIYSVTEIANQLNLHTETIKRYIHTGKLPATKKGIMWLVTKADLNDLIESQWFQVERAIDTGKHRGKPRAKKKAKSCS